MTKKWKKSLAILLTLSMVSGMLTIAASAATVTVKDEEDSNNPIEIVFESSSTTLQESDEDQEFTISVTASYDENGFYRDDIKVDPEDISHWKSEVKALKLLASTALSSAIRNQETLLRIRTIRNP